MDAINFRDAVVGLQLVWMIGLSIAVWLRKPGEDAKAAIGVLKESITRQDVAVAAALAALKAKDDLIEERIKGLPTHGDMRTLISDMAALKGDMSSVRQGQQAQQRTLELIQEFMTKNAR